ncbi:MAG: hypothetical protein K2R98_33140 [Gemmataceae bacterium]|nr:hypothetical protein [Gemmataceae bacterium]
MDARLEAFVYLYCANEPVILFLALPFLAGCYLWLCRGQSTEPTAPLQPIRRWGIWVLALLVFLTTLAGTLTIYHRFPLTLDEYVVRWQAQVFLAGKVNAPIEGEFLFLESGLRPFLVNFHPQKQEWSSGYWPVYALMYTPFAAADVGELLNPTLAAGTIPLIASVARKLWPDEDHAPGVAALLLATSSQFLITGMSFYSMPAHLLLNLFWLWLYLRGDWAAWLPLPWVGVAAMGLHQPLLHALFVVPFLLRLVRTRAWSVTLYTAAVYLAGCIWWYRWMFVTETNAAPTEESGLVNSWIASAFSWPHGHTIIFQMMSLLELCSWQNLATVVLAVVGLLQIRQMSSPIRDLTYSLGLTYLFFFFLSVSQGHGWGNRYLHGVLGNLVLLAVAGGLALRNQGGALPFRRLVVATTVFSLAVQLPIRAWQVERFIRPFARAMVYLEQMPEEVVVIDSPPVWHSRDLVRNEPFLGRRPLVLDGQYLSAKDRAQLCQRYSVRFIRPEELTALGLFRTASPGEDTPEP